MKKIILFFILSFTLFSKEGTYLSLSGSFDGNIEAVMNINVKDNKITGSYYYDKYKQPIELSGIMEDNRIELKEENGSFTGIKDEKNTYSGMWQDLNGKKIGFRFKIVEEEKIKYFNKKKKNNEIDFQYIEFRNKKMDKMIRENLFSTKNWEEIKKSIFSEVKDNDEDNKYYFYDGFEVIFKDENILTIKRWNYEYTGGAHGISGAQYYVFDLKKMEIIKLRDIFSGDYKNYIGNIISNKVKADENVENLFDAGYFTDKIEMSENIGMTEKGIIFCYQPYEIASYARGVVEIFIPFSKINKKYLKFTNKE